MRSFSDFCPVSSELCSLHRPFSLLAAILYVQDPRFSQQFPMGSLHLQSLLFNAVSWAALNCTLRRAALAALIEKPRCLPIEWRADLSTAFWALEKSLYLNQTKDWALAFCNTVECWLLSAPSISWWSVLLPSPKIHVRACVSGRQGFARHLCVNYEFASWLCTMSHAFFFCIKSSVFIPRSHPRVGE